MKKIDTLVEDIYKLFDLDPIQKDESEVDKLIDTFGNMLKEHIKEFLYKEPEGKGRLRLSGIGKPDRQLWYDVNREKESTPVSSSTRIKFLYGHILEELLIAFSRLAGHTVTDTQKELSVAGVKGHQDCVIDGVLVDCKSTSPRGFEKFQKADLVRDDPFGYIAQISAYAKGNEVDEAAFLAINKQSGEICLTPVHSLEMIDAEDRVEYLKVLVQQKSPPNRCYSDVKDGVSGNKRLGTSCIYCNHKRECWRDSNNGQGLRVFNYARGYRYLTNVGKIPDVPEVVNW